MLLGVEEWAPDGPRAEQDLEELAGVLYASVHAGASVSFVLPFSMEDAQAFWRDKVLPGVKKRGRIVLTARARALMEAVENVARRERRTLITLDTRTGDSAERFTARWGTCWWVSSRDTRSIPTGRNWIRRASITRN